MWIIKIFIFCLILYQISFATDTTKEKEPEPPPPPIPFSEVYKKDLPAQGQQQKTEEVTDIMEIPEYVIQDFVQKRDRILPYLRDYKNLTIQPFQSQYLRQTNTFYYTPSVPVLIYLPFKIKHVVMTNPGTSQIGGQQKEGGGNVHSVYDDKYLIVFPPPPTTDVWSFIVVSEDNQPYYFFGERATSSLSKNKHVVPFISYTYQTYSDDRRLIISYYQNFKRCPYHGEVVEVNGNLYRFIIKDTKLIASDSYISFCGKIYEVLKIK